MRIQIRILETEIFYFFLFFLGRAGRHYSCSSVASSLDNILPHDPYAELEGQELYLSTDVLSSGTVHK